MSFIFFRFIIYRFCVLNNENDKIRTFTCKLKGVCNLPNSCFIFKCLYTNTFFYHETAIVCQDYKQMYRLFIRYLIVYNYLLMIFKIILSNLEIQCRTNITFFIQKYLLIFDISFTNNFVLNILSILPLFK